MVDRQPSPATPLGFAVISQKQKGRATREGGSGIAMDWCRLGVATGSRRGEVSHLSTRGNIRLGSPFCDAR